MKIHELHKKHWDNVYNTKAETGVNWFQLYPKTSMEFVKKFQLPVTTNIIDIGGGNSRFVDALLDFGYQNIWVLDISAAAIEKTKMRPGDNAAKINWIISDVTEFDPGISFDLWHDRAAFHLLTTGEKIGKYISIANSAMKKDGYLVIGTFSETGPEKCSGLPVKQYSETLMTTIFENNFEKLHCINEEHLTSLRY